MAANTNYYPRTVSLLLIAIVISTIAFGDGLLEIVRRWSEEQEYGHGPLLVIIALFFIVQQWPRINAVKVSHRWLGGVMVFVSLLLLMVGEISSLFILIHYGFLLNCAGILVSIYGIRVIPAALPSFIILLFAVPLPYFIQTTLTINLQLVSSVIGVWIIQVFSIPVFLEGNLIDLGTMKLQVVEACAGLRYLFSLLSLGFICAYLFQAELWKRAFILISTVPITIGMNSFRIAVTGILAHYAGKEMAEGFIHSFQGVVIFAICLILLFIEMWILSRIGKTADKDFRAIFGVDFSIPRLSIKSSTPSGYVIFVALALTIAAGIFQLQLDGRTEEVPDRKAFAHFPETLGQWSGQTLSLPPDVVKTLKLSDYVSIDYRLNGESAPVNFYIAYYASQRKGASPHSPRVCIPGGGWEIRQINRTTLDIDGIETPIALNRAVISKGHSQQLVYYWFQQRGKSIANEYVMKWLLFKDVLMLNRSDGALVRLVTPILPDQPASAADKRLKDLIQEVMPIMGHYVPE